VEISWTVRREGETHLFLRWAECGGPPVKKPTRTGFGSRLIERSLARELAGEVALTYEPTGVICTISAPVPPPGLLERKNVAAPARIAPLPLAG
jgi:two-component sensor histidine kinase